MTIDDPISFSGSIYFVTGMSDAAGYFGYFNAESQTRIIERADPDAGFPMENMMGICLADSSAVGYYFNPLVSSADRQSASHRDVVFTPGYERHRFAFDYDPAANNGVGRVEVTLDGKQFGFDITSHMRKTGAVLDRFGFANVRRGGHSVEFYLDDLSYTARRVKGDTPRFHKQTYVKAPYPHKSAGRRY